MRGKNLFEFNRTHRIQINTATYHVRLPRFRPIDSACVQLAKTRTNNVTGVTTSSWLMTPRLLDRDRARRSWKAIMKYNRDHERGNLSRQTLDGGRKKVGTIRVDWRLPATSERINFLNKEVTVDLPNIPSGTLSTRVSRNYGSLKMHSW